MWDGARLTITIERPLLRGSGLTGTGWFSGSLSHATPIGTPGDGSDRS